MMDDGSQNNLFTNKFKQSTGKPPHGCKNQIAPRLPDKCVLWASWDEYDNFDIDIGVDDDVVADDCFEHLLD